MQRCLSIKTANIKGLESEIVGDGISSKEIEEVLNLRLYNFKYFFA